MIDIIYKYGFFLLIATIIIILSLKGSTQQSKQYLRQLQDNVEALNDSIAAIEDKNFFLQDRITDLQDSLEVSESELKKIENKRIATIKYYEKKIHDLNNLNVVELDSFFTNRYGQPGDDTEANSH